MLMDIKYGTAGEIPDRDVFSIFSSSKRKFVSVEWNDTNPINWCLSLKDKESDTDCVQLLISDISEVMLEVEPSRSFRIYKSSDVVRLTPILGTSKEEVQ